MRGNAFLTWLYALDRGYRNEEEMVVLSDMTEGLRNFATRYNYAINDPELLRRYRFYEDGQRDVATRISVAEKKGAENTKIKIARSLKARGISLDVISETTGLSMEQIGEL